MWRVTRPINEPISQMSCSSLVKKHRGRFGWLRPPDTAAHYNP